MSKTVINSLKKVCTPVEKSWWQSLQTERMERDKGNHTRWKHKWRWHNRGNVWCKIATEWAGEEDWMRARIRKSTLEKKYQFVTFVLDRMNLSIEHKKSKGIGKKVKDKTPRKLGPADTAIHTRIDWPTVQLCGDSNVLCKGSVVNFLWGRSTEEESDKFKGRETCPQRKMVLDRRDSSE